MYTDPTQAQPGTSIQQIHVLYSFAVDPDADINQDIHNAPEVESDTPPEDEDPSPIFPAISLHPLDGSFEPKLRLLRRSLRIGRQYDSRTLPTATNGFFDSKLLSRQHAKIWVHGGKMFIKDLGSANGTFLNGLRLSPSGQKSRRKEIHTDDILVCYSPYSLILMTSLLTYVSPRNSVSTSSTNPQALSSTKRFPREWDAYLVGMTHGERKDGEKRWIDYGQNLESHIHSCFHMIGVIGRGIRSDPSSIMLVLFL